MIPSAVRASLRSLLLSLFALFISSVVGCVSTGVTPVGSSHYPPLPPTHEVLIFSSETEIKKPFEVIGIITHNDPGKYRVLTLNDAIPALKEKARFSGANGIIIDESRAIKSGIISTGISVKARAILIKE
jgi:hypothetical protein